MICNNFLYSADMMNVLLADGFVDPAVEAALAATAIDQKSCWRQA